MDSLEASVRNHVSLFVNGYVSADRLNDLLPDTGELDDAGDPVAVAVVMRTIGYLAEYQAGDRLEDDVRRSLSKDASWTSDGGVFSAAVTRRGDSADAEPLRVVVGTQFRAVFV